MLLSNKKILTLIHNSTKPSPFDISNKVLYDLCSDYPEHKHNDQVIAKILLIGRAYAAAIERRKNKDDGQLNDSFYTETVAPRIISSSIDKWISEAKEATDTADRIKVLLDVHAKTTQLFHEISKSEKRSLASKYLHFHVPNLFYIFDSRAVIAMSKIAAIVGRASNKTNNGIDNEYRKFVEKCLRIETCIKTKFGVTLTPRQLDNILLAVHALEEKKFTTLIPNKQFTRE